jgi:hypothetical protein
VIEWIHESTQQQKSEQRISIRFPLDVLAAIRALAKQDERPFNGEVIWALRGYLERHKSKQQ